MRKSKLVRDSAGKIVLTERIPGIGEVHVVEGAAGMWHYHLAVVGESTTLCGRRDGMRCEMPVSQFGASIPEDYHIPISFCTECEQQLRRHSGDFNHLSKATTRSLAKWQAISRKMDSLLNDPHPGLDIWVACLSECLDELRLFADELPRELQGSLHG